MISDNYWCSTTLPPVLNLKAALPKKTDILIIGGGLTGLLTLHHILKQNPYEDVILIDEYLPGLFASGRCLGAACIDNPQYLINQYDLELASTIINATRENNQGIASLITDQNINCEFNKCGGFHLFEKFSEAKQTYNALKKLHTEPYSLLLNEQELKSVLGDSPYLGGVFCPSELNINPLKLITILLEQGLSKKVITMAGVEKINKSKNGFEARVHKRGKITANRVVYCTNTTDLIFDAKVLTRFYLYNVATPQLETSYPYNFTFQDGVEKLRYHEGRAIMQGLRTVDNKVLFDKLIQFMYQAVPGSQGSVGFVWMSEVDKAKDWLPVCGPIPGRSGEFINVGNDLNTVFTASAAMAEVLSGGEHPYSFMGMERL